MQVVIWDNTQEGPVNINKHMLAPPPLNIAGMLI